MKFDKTLDKRLDNPIVRVSLSIVLFIAFIIYVPIAIITFPFIFAWECAGYVMQNAKKKNVSNESINIAPSKWGDFIFDLSSWSKMEDE